MRLPCTLIDFQQKLRLFFGGNLSFATRTQDDNLMEQLFEVGFIELMGCLNEFVEAHGWLWLVKCLI
jgi:hypothetical protein